MFFPKPFCTCNVRRLGARVAVYAGLGMSLSIAGLTAQAGDILRGGSSTGARGAGRASNVTANPVAPTPALGNARDALARTTKAMQAVQAMQAAARDAARRGANNLGFIPHQPGKPLPNVPNGLTPGGLQVLPGVPVDLANPVAGENRDLWKGAKLPKQKVDGGQTIVTIKQTEPQALLNWKTFNVGKETVVNFNQKGGTQKDGSNNWVAFNKIADPSGVPSQILGSINADGTVYLINHNGIVFGGSSQISLRSLVASALPINDNLISRGLLNNPDAQFLFSALDVPGGSDGTPAFVPEPPPASGRFGDVIVQPGAFLHSPASGEGNGGRLMLVGANVRNEGTLSTPSGQTILAAGLQVAVAAHANDDPSLRGLDVWVGSIGDYAGTVTNSGLITSLTGSTTLTGRNVHQFGIIESSTSVDLNGRIDLRASYGAVSNPNFDNSDATRGFGGPPFLFQHTGVVKFGEQSVTRILPDPASDRTVPGLTLPEQSQINVEGLAIHLAENAMMLAPNADVTLRAGVWPYKDADGNRTTFDATGLPEARLGPSFYSGRNQKFLFSGGQIYLDNSALISVAGSTDVFVPLTQNILDVQFLGSEFADSPVQREGVLRGVPLTVDIRRSGVNNGRFWIGTPLGDVTGLAGLIQRNAAQLTAAGGNLTLRAGDSIVVKAGATLDVSGGFFRHEEGMVRTSRLLQDGRLVDIANAQPGQVYDGVYTGQFFKDQPRWGVTETYTSPFMSGERFEASYIEGADGGTLTLSAASMAVDGELRGLTVDTARGRSLAPEHSRLSISFAAEKIFEVSSSTLEILPTSPTPPSIIFAHSPSQISPEPFRLVDDLPAPLREERVATVFLSPALLDEQGFGHLSIANTDGNITLPAGVKLAAPALGSITLAGANVTINSEVLAPGGTLQFTAYNISPAFTAEFPLANPQGALAPLPNENRGSFTLGAKGALTVEGLLVDDRIGSDDFLTKPLVTNGGTITIDAYSAMLRNGSSIDASGGVALSARGVPSYGNAGSVTIRTGKDPAFGTVLGGTFHLGATLRGYSGARGGSLTLQANAIQIGGTTSFANTLLLQPGFFRKGGFANYALVGIGAARDAEEAPGEPEIYTPGILIAPGARIEPVARGLLALPVGPDAGEFVLSEVLRPVGLRAPASVSFSALGADDVFTVDRLEARGDVVVGKGAEIIVDPTASISLRGQTVTMLGSAVAPGGSIVIAGASRFPLPADQAANATFARPTVYIGAQAQLSTAGTAVVLPDAFDRRVGNLLAGGTISVSGNIVAERGAILNVSGASAEFDLHPSMLGLFELPAVPQNSGVNTPLWTLQSVSTDLDSNGGVLDLQGSEMLFTDATLLGQGGGETAIGATLSIFSGRFYTATAARTSADINLVVTQSGRTLPTGSENHGVGLAVRGANGEPIAAMGYFAADRFTQGGFDSLDLGFKFIDASPFPFGGNVEFRGPIHIVAPGKLRVAGGGVIQADGAVRLTGSYAALGQPFRPPLHPDDPLIPFQQSPAAPSAQFVFAPTFGPGTLSVRAELIDIGTLSLQNVGSARLVAAGGDIRGNGTLNIAGDLILTAGQIYPTTLATFNIFAYDHDGGPGSVTITSAGVRSAPLSAGGTLNVFASEISQQGVLRAPLGSITLGWDGTDLDRSDADLDRPFNPIAGNSAQIGTSKSVMLGNLSITSVAGVAGAAEMLIPFGLSPDGSSWIDPRGVNVTLNGLPEKRVSMKGDSVVAKRGSTVDIRGGGNLSAFRWVPGLGGSIDLLGSASGEWNAGVEYFAGDLVNSGGRTWAARVRNSGERPSSSLFWSLVPESYAVLPAFSSEFAPYAPFNTGANAEALGGDPGFVSSGLQVGDRLFLDGVEGLDAGFYTLLPRKYALLPGAFLVTPTTERPVGTFTLPEGATLTSGLRVNTFSRPGELTSVRTRFEVAPSEVVQARVQYDDYSGNQFFREAAARFDVKRPQRLPMDAGFAAIHGNVGLDTLGSILTAQPLTGRGAGIDLSSSADIYIVAQKGAPPAEATAILNTGVLNSWGAESLVIGGLRRTEPDATLVDVRTAKLIVDNAGKSLAAPDITLLSRETLALETGSSVKSSGPLSSFAEKLEIDGDGTLVRVSGARGADIVRSGVGNSTEPLLTIAADSRIAGRNVTLDSTYGTSLDASTTLRSKILTLGSGQISIILNAQSTELAGSIVEPHLVLAGDILNDVQQVSALTLRSYRTIDFYGAGEFGNDSLGKLTLFAGGLRGYDQGAGSARLQSRTVSFENPSNVAAVAAPAAVSGTLQFDAGTIVFGSNVFTAAGYETVVLNATGGVLGEGTGSFTAQNALRVTSPIVTGARGSMQTIAAGGALVLESNGAEATVSGGLGASFTFRGSSVLANGDIVLPSGQVVLRATTGDVIVGGTLNVDGTKRQFYDLTRFSDAGSISLIADAGDIELVAGSLISVAATEGGNAGSLIVNASQGELRTTGATLRGSATVEKHSASFSLDVGTLPSFSDVASALNVGGFLEQRDFRVRTGDVVLSNPLGQTNAARIFTLAADQGDIRVTGTIDASGKTGGQIALVAGGSLILEAGSLLTVHGKEFSNAGKGGEIRLEAGAAFNGQPNLVARLDVQSGSTIDLGVDSFLPGAYTTPGSSAFRGQFTGKLHLRAPRIGSDLNINPLGGSIVGASAIVAEAYQVYDRTGIGTLDNTLRDAIHADNEAFITAGDASIRQKFLGGNPDAAGLDSVLVLAPGVEIINRTGNLTLGTTADNAANDWNLATFRYGPQGAPGVLTLRAAGNIEILNALSDGFSGGVPAGTPAGQQLWLSRLMDITTSLPVNTQSWSYRLTAGADLRAVDFRRVQSTGALDQLAQTNGSSAPLGSVQIGKFYPAVLVSGPDATTAAAINNRYQVVRTGSGDIEIHAGRDLQLRNQFASVYTAGVRVADPTTIFAPGDFVRPIIERGGQTHPNQGSLGAVQQVYPAQWSMAGGNVAITAQGDAARVTLHNGQVIADSSRQLPSNWLYRRGVIDSGSGLFGAGGVNAPSPFQNVNDPSASTAWWIDFSNFFEGIGALGGGDVKLAAGSNIVNVDAFAPTNARMPGRDAVTGTNLAPDASKLVELGGGDLLVRAGANIDGGVYYVERGQGTLFAGQAITTNSARSPSLGILGSTSFDPTLVESNTPAIFDRRTWLPTTLFVGKSDFDVSARGDILLGPAANPFFLPQGVNNKFWYKTYFNTFAQDASVTVASFGGSVTHRLAVTLPTGSTIPTLQAFIGAQNLLTTANASNHQPWIRITELDVGGFGTVLSVTAPAVRTTAFAGDVNIVGPLTLFPAPRGTLELAASGGVIGLQPSGRLLTGSALTAVTGYTAATINISDANPLATLRVTSPLAYQNLVGRELLAVRDSQVSAYGGVDLLFQETGSFTGAAATIETQRALHAPGPLHFGDESPVRIYAGAGDITGLTLFSPKTAQVLAKNDIADVSFYVQNVVPTDISVIAAGRDIIPHNENATVRTLADDLARGNAVVDTLRSTVSGPSNLLAGDIQINGPGVLEVLAGRNLDLGTGANFTDGTGVGLTSIGNARNPFLPIAGADIIAFAGVKAANGKGPALGLAGSSLDVERFISEYVEGTELDSAYLDRIGFTGTFDTLTTEQQAIVGLEVFYRELRDAGRNFPTVGTYQSGLDAIDTLFGDSSRVGEIFTRARDIRTSADGNISLGAPQGGLTMASDIFGNPLTPPGVVTESGGGISIFTNTDVDIGQARIFTLRGGDIMIWSSTGDIAAGTAPKTVVTAPPTRVVIDVSSANVKTDLGGLATGGGIGVLAAVEGVEPGDVDLIAPQGVVDAGDAGIRVSGNLNIAATQVLNASNIAVSGASAGVPSTPTVATPSLGSLTAASSTVGATNSAANQVAKQQQTQAQPKEELPSIITVEVLGFGGGGPTPEEEEDEEERTRSQEAAEPGATAQASEGRSAGES